MTETIWLFYDWAMPSLVPIHYFIPWYDRVLYSTSHTIFKYYFHFIRSVCFIFERYILKYGHHRNEQRRMSEEPKKKQAEVFDCIFWYHHYPVFHIAKKFMMKIINSEIPENFAHVCTVCTPSELSAAHLHEIVYNFTFNKLRNCCVSSNCKRIVSRQFLISFAKFYLAAICAI